MGEGMSGIAHSRIYAIMPPRDRIRIWGADGRALAADPRAGGGMQSPDVLQLFRGAVFHDGC